MQHQFLQVFRLAFALIKGAVYLVFTIALGNDLSNVHSVFATTVIVGVVLAALAAFFDPIFDILLRAGLIALVVLVANGSCSNPTLETGVKACVATAGVTAFDAITDVIHRLLAQLPPHHSLPKVIKT